MSLTSPTRDIIRLKKETANHFARRVVWLKSPKGAASYTGLSAKAPRIRPTQELGRVISLLIPTDQLILHNGIVVGFTRMTLGDPIRTAYLIESPVTFKTRAGRIHCTDGPAVEWSDGFKVYALEGLLVPEFWVLRPQRITLATILKETNQERRSLLLRIIDHERVLKSAKRLISKDSCGRLWHIIGLRAVFVEVVNSTAEPDGTFKTYWLQVPPNMRRAKQAVAWTFGMNEDEYVLDKET